MPRKSYICKHCGKSFIDTKCSKYRVYCSKPCQYTGRKKQIVFSCAHCGKEFEGPLNTKGRKRFCSRACLYAFRRSRIIKTCPQCDASFEVITSNKARKYCSKKCHLDAGWIPSDPSKKVIKNCERCGQEFTSWTYRKARFCSVQCGNEWMARQPKPGSRKPEIHITQDCAWCGELYQTTTHQVRLRGSRFCSVACRAEMMSIERRGEGNPMWNGGHVNDYGPNWGRQKRRAIWRDEHCCQNCGYKSGGDSILDVHHIIPFKTFNGDWETANQLSNLIVLCRLCHRRVELGKTPCPNIKAQPA